MDARTKKAIVNLAKDFIFLLLEAEDSAPRVLVLIFSPVKNRTSVKRAR
jgi:hypothetical protein